MTIIGAVVVIGTVMLAPGPLIAEEIVAQALLFAVFVAAVHGGISGGFIGALSASLVYAVIRMDLISPASNGSSDFAAMVAIRAIGFSMIGFVVGWISARVRQSLEIAQNLEGIDALSLGYNHRLIAMTLAASIGESQRYGNDFSVICIGLTVDGPKISTKSQNKLLASAAEVIRSTIRAVDRFGRTDDGGFVLVLPNTDKQGADSLMTRLTEAIQDKLDVSSVRMTMTSLCSTTQMEEIRQYHRSLTGS